MHLKGRPPLPYDVLSINTGIIPAIASVPGATEHCVPVKPISTFVERFQQLRQRARDSPHPLRVRRG